tara:strand:- start:159 stop:593 length:435 start_codon:yes stop_codon:yes gene_type:complete
MKNDTQPDSDLIGDIAIMHSKFGVYGAVSKMTPEMKREFLALRWASIYEEVVELDEAIDQKDPEEIVDALIDIMVFTLGTLDVFNVDAAQAWKQVLKANMAKNVGVKEGRPNPFGLPDLVKPEGWQPPSHAGNHGMLSEMYPAK